MKFLLISFFLLMSFCTFSQQDSTIVTQKYFSQRSLLFSQTSFTSNTLLPISGYLEDSNSKPYIFGNMYPADNVYDGTYSLRGINPGELLFLVTANYLIFTIDKNFFSKTQLKKRNTYLKY